MYSFSVHIFNFNGSTNSSCRIVAPVNPYNNNAIMNANKKLFIYCVNCKAWSTQASCLHASNNIYAQFWIWYFVCRFWCAHKLCAEIVRHCVCMCDVWIETMFGIKWLNDAIGPLRLYSFTCGIVVRWETNWMNAVACYVFPSQHVCVDVIDCDNPYGTIVTINETATSDIVKL